MKRTTKLAIAVGTAVALGLAVAEASAHAGGMGWGGSNGMGFAMHGQGMGSGMGPGTGMHGQAMGYGMGPGAGMHGQGMGPQAMFNGNAKTSQERLDGLQSELGITAEQDGAWQAFVKSAKQQDESRQAWLSKMQEARTAGSLPEFRAQQDELFKQRQAAREAATSSLKDLYAALTPAQKTIADRSLGGFGAQGMAGAGHGHFAGHHGPLH